MSLHATTNGNNEVLPPCPKARATKQDSHKQNKTAVFDLFLTPTRANFLLEGKRKPIKHRKNVRIWPVDV